MILEHAQQTSLAGLPFPVAWLCFAVQSNKTVCSPLITYTQTHTHTQSIYSLEKGLSAESRMKDITQQSHCGLHQDASEHA